MAPTEHRDENKQPALQVIDVWDGGDPDSLDGVVAEDVVLNAVDQQGRGRDTYKGRVHTFRKVFPNLICKANEVVPEDDKVVVHHTARATHEGELMGIEGCLLPHTFHRHSPNGVNDD